MDPTDGKTPPRPEDIPEGFNSETFPLQKREYGGVQPFIKAGPFNIRLPLIHHEWSWTEFAAAMFLGVACLGAGVATTMTAFGINRPENIAALGLTENGAFLMSLTFGVWNAICYYLPSLLGDPVVPGWITPSLPLTLSYLNGYAMPNYAADGYNVDRIHAMIALQMLVALSFLIMGATGLGRKLVEGVPMAIKAGIVLGAGVTAGMNVIQARLPSAPWTVIIAVALSFIFLFNNTFARKAETSAFFRLLRNQGVVPAQLFAIILAPWLLGEIPKPVIQWGITPFDPGFVMKHFTIFGIGWPAAKFFINAIPMAITVYIIAFSDFVLAKEMVSDATAPRKDETVIFDAGRSNLVSFLRNGIMSLFAPWVPMCGPLWASGLLTVTERYKRGYKTLRSYWGGVCTFRAATVIAVLILPLVTLIRPAFFIFFGITMAVQCWACGNIGMRMATTPNQRGIATVIAATLACVNPSWALLVGVVAWLIVEGSEAWRDYTLKNQGGTPAAPAPEATAPGADDNVRIAANPEERKGC